MSLESNSWRHRRESMRMLRMHSSRLLGEYTSSLGAVTFRRLRFTGTSKHVSSILNPSPPDRAPRAAATTAPFVPGKLPLHHSQAVVKCSKHSSPSPSYELQERGSVNISADCNWIVSYTFSFDLSNVVIHIVLLLHLTQENPF